jgi:hypothetical protein
LLGTSILADEPRHPRAEPRHLGPGFAAGDYAFGDLATIGDGLSKSTNIQLYLVTFEANLGYAYVLSGRLRDGLEFLEHAVGQEVSARKTRI